MLIILAWGDADALAEAGFCYAQGVGCKKDLKKSAKFYRQAEAKGISMIGNSWYVLIVSNRSVRLTVN
jgi:TPR repeat protein